MSLTVLDRVQRVLFFFFQAEDGIRDKLVTGVQTCALPISTAEALTAALRADSAAVANAQLNLEWATIRAPIAGRTGRLLVREGDLVRANAAEPLGVINQIRPILGRFPVPERSLPDIQRHRNNRRPVRVSPSKEDTTASEGLLTFVDNAVDTTTGTVLLKGEFPNRDNALWPGEFLSVRLEL